MYIYIYITICLHSGFEQKDAIVFFYSHLSYIFVVFRRCRLRLQLVHTLFELTLTGDGEHATFLTDDGIGSRPKNQRTLYKKDLIDFVGRI